MGDIPFKTEPGTVYEALLALCRRRGSFTRDDEDCRRLAAFLEAVDDVVTSARSVMREGRPGDMRPEVDLVVQRARALLDEAGRYSPVRPESRT